jgi:hypothetical protein
MPRRIRAQAPGACRGERGSRQHMQLVVKNLFSNLMLWALESRLTAWHQGPHMQCQSTAMLQHLLLL